MNKFLVFGSLFLVGLLVMVAPDVMAQPPGFPTPAPDQAPIDGGLSVVAVGAGAWAINKLRRKKRA